MAYYSQYRFRKLGLERLIDFLYSPPDHDLPDGLLREHIRFYDPAHYALERTEHRFTPPGELKPNPEILRSILRSLTVSAEQAIPVVSHPQQDLVMRQHHLVTAAPAAHGADPQPDPP